MKVKIEIDSDNDAMQTREQAVECIIKAAQRIRHGLRRDSGKLLDVNGNTVGTWSVEL